MEAFWEQRLGRGLLMKMAPVNPTILCGDILNEAEIDPLKTVGDPRTDLSKANAAYNVVMAQDRVSNITYFNGFEVRYG